jgi:hypothetical protein
MPCFDKKLSVQLKREQMNVSYSGRYGNSSARDLIYLQIGNSDIIHLFQGAFHFIRRDFFGCGENATFPLFVPSKSDGD